jgi:hypothetical protein
VAVIFAPEHYLGPSGFDRVFYFAYVRSLVLDGDLRFANEIALKQPSGDPVVRGGEPLNKYPIGAPILALPAYVITHITLQVVSAPGSQLTGYERPYVYSYALSQLAAALVGVLLLYKVMTRYFDPLLSALSAGGAVLGTDLLRYTSIDLLMSQAASFFAVTWCLLEAIRLRERAGDQAQWFRVGLAAGFMVTTRLQNVVYLMVPAVAVAEASWTQRGLAVALSRCWASGIAGVAIGLLPQSAAWRTMNGSWFSNGYAAEAAFTWTAPAVGIVAASLAKWWPLLVLGAASSVRIAVVRADAVLAAAAAGQLATIYVTASWWAPDIARRVAFDNLMPIAIGLGLLATVARTRRKGLEMLVLVVPAAWNVPFVNTDAYSRLTRLPDVLADWWRGLVSLGI